MVAIPLVLLNEFYKPGCHTSKKFLTKWSGQLLFKLKRCFVVLCWVYKYNTLSACKHPKVISTHRDSVICRLGAIPIHHGKVQHTSTTSSLQLRKSLHTFIHLHKGK